MSIDESLDKNLEIALLLDYYGELLTPKQRNVIDLYYNQDLSLGEIAEQENITRQGVRDSIKRGEQTLTELERTLKVAAKSVKLLKAAAFLEKAAEAPDREKILRTAGDIRRILEE